MLGAQTSIRKLQEFFLLPEVDSPAKSSSTLAEHVCMEIVRHYRSHISRLIFVERC